MTFFDLFSDAAVFSGGWDVGIGFDVILDFLISAGGILALNIFDFSPSAGPISCVTGEGASGNIFEIR